MNNYYHCTICGAVTGTQGLEPCPNGCFGNLDLEENDEVDTEPQEESNK